MSVAQTTNVGLLAGRPGSFEELSWYAVRTRPCFEKRRSASSNKRGDKVCIRGGSLDGVSGVLEAVKGDKSLVISVNLIQRSIAMRVEGFRVEAVRSMRV